MISSRPGAVTRTCAPVWSSRKRQESVAGLLRTASAPGGASVGGAVARDFAHLKNRLMPYLYGAAVEATRTGVPVMRPMVLEFPDDPPARCSTGGTCSAATCWWPRSSRSAAGRRGDRGVRLRPERTYGGGVHRPA
ncbi:TIM-barrel domain-containing protein [Actinoallomurus iriomotensis]|nr:TIM-barrel domain-containing protein [Actinoallomurus iriomotensis]